MDITRPDGSSEVFGPFSTLTGDIVENYVPTMVGTYSFRFYGLEETIGSDTFLFFESTTETLVVQPEPVGYDPIASFTISPTSPVIGEEVVFNGSQSYVPFSSYYSIYYWFIRDSLTGELLSNFTTSSPFMSNTFSIPGVYNVTFEIEGPFETGDIITDQITVEEPSLELVIEVEGSGTTDPEPGVYAITPPDTLVVIEAFPDPNWTFDYWLARAPLWNGSSNWGSENPISFYQNSTGYVITAVFTDSTPPTGSIMINEGAATTDSVDVNLTLSASDPQSGVSQMRFRNNGGVWSNWETYSTTKSWSLSSGDGLKRIQVDFRNGVGLTYATYADITLNTSVPVVYYDLIIGATGSGTTSPAVGTYTYEKDTVVDITATANSGWSFSHWLVDSQNPGATNSTIQLPMVSNRTVTAVFDEKPNNDLTISVSGSGITSPSVGTYTYEEDTVVQVTATPNSGWKLDHWLLDDVNVGNANPLTVTMDNNHRLTSVFSGERPSLDISVTGSGSTNPVLGTRLYDRGTVVVVEAFPENGWKLDHWLLDDVNVGNANSYSVVTDDNHVLKAIFAKVPPPLISVLSWNPNNPLENEIVDVKFTISCEAGDISEVIFLCRVSEGEWNEVFLDLDGETWIAAIPGHNAGDVVDFYIESIDSFGNLAISDVFSYLVNEPAITLDLVLVVALGGSGVTLGSFGVYRALIQAKSMSSNKIKEKAKKKNRKEEKQEEEENRERKSESKKGKPYLKVKISVPPTLIATKSYKAEIIIVNEGLVAAKNIQTKVDATPGLNLEKKIGGELKELKVGEKKLITFPFKASEQLEKGIYKLSFEVENKNTKDRIYSRYLRGLKIGILLGSDKFSQMNSFQQWLKEHEYVWDELSKVDDYLKLRRYDLLILAPDLELGKKEIKIISKFVGNGQSLLAIDKITADDQKGFMKILGYNVTDFKSFKSMNGVLRIADDKHVITKGLTFEDKIPLGAYWGNASISNNSGDVIAVQNITTKNGDQITIPAIVINKYGNGKSFHLNFHAEETISQINNLLENALNWLLNEHSSEKVHEA